MMGTFSSLILIAALVLIIWRAVASPSRKEIVSDPSKEDRDQGGPNPKHRQEVIRWARDVLADPDGHAIIDTETTGLGRTAEVIQVAVINSAGDILLDSFVRPVALKQIPSEASAINGITISMLKNAPTFDEIASVLRSALRGRTVICYNAAYDGRLLNQTAQKTGSLPLNGQWACAMLAYARFRQEWNYEKDGYRWHKLPGGDHSALGDCQATLRLIEEMAGERISESRGQ
jgi:DNA polymerase-3 subunit epsilon